VKTFLALQLLWAVCSLRAADFSEVRGTRKIGQVPAFSQYGRVQLPAAEALISVPKTAAAPANTDLMVMFDPATGHFLWFTNNPSPKYPPSLNLIDGVIGTAWDALYSSKDCMTFWHANSEPAVVFTSTSSAFDLNEAFDRSLLELKAGWDRYYSRGAEPPNLQKVALLPLDELERRRFLYDDTKLVGSAVDIAIPAIDSITQTEDGYRIRLRARWVAEVVVGNDLKVREPFHRAAEK